MRTPGVSYGVAILADSIVTNNSSSTNDDTSLSIIYSDASRVPSYFAIPISYSCEIVGIFDVALVLVVFLCRPI